MPYVVNIGFGISTGAWPRILSAALIVLASTASYLVTDEFLGEPLWLVVNTWAVYVFGHLGISYLLASILATPGCEMRAIPHLLGLATGKEVAEHFCPAFMDNLDKWEHERSNNGSNHQQLATDDPRLKDILGNPGRLLLIYGIPFLAIQLTGNFGGFAIATQVPALAFLAMSLVCFVNIARCRRVHCYLLGPLFLLAGIGLGLYSFRLFSFGSSTWSIIVNSALIGGACVSFHMETILGTYFGNKQGKNHIL